MSFTHQKLAVMQEQANTLLDDRPSVFRIGIIVMFLRLISSFLGFGLIVCGIILIFTSDRLPIEVIWHDIKIPNNLLGMALVLLGILLSVIAFLCRVIRRRNWYVLESFEILDWVAALPMEEEGHSKIPGERELFRSSDNNILLTTHRLVDRVEIIDREIKHKDVLKCEILYKKQSYYIVLAVIFSVLFVSSLLMPLLQPWLINDSIGVNEMQVFWFMAAILCGVAYYCLFQWTKRTLKVTGKYRVIEIDVQAFKKENLKTFVAALREQIAMSKE